MENARMRNTGMCEKCVEIDKKIRHYKWVATQLNDPPTNHGLDELIKRYEAEKSALHREPES